MMVDRVVKTSAPWRHFPEIILRLRRCANHRLEDKPIHLADRPLLTGSSQSIREIRVFPVAAICDRR
jgi:hypothetical protein